MKRLLAHLQIVEASIGFHEENTRRRGTNLLRTLQLNTNEVTLLEIRNHPPPSGGLRLARLGKRLKHRRDAAPAQALPAFVPVFAPGILSERVDLDM